MQTLKKTTGIICLAVCLTLLCVSPEQLSLLAMSLQFGFILASGSISYRLLNEAR